jgi:hypothetical protein
MNKGVTYSVVALFVVLIILFYISVRTGFKTHHFCRKRRKLSFNQSGTKCKPGYYSSVGSNSCKSWTTQPQGFNKRYFPNTCYVGQDCEWKEVPNSIWCTKVEGTCTSGDENYNPDGNIPNATRTSYVSWSDAKWGERILAGGTSGICSRFGIPPTCYCMEPNYPWGSGSGLSGAKCSQWPVQCGTAQVTMEGFCNTFLIQEMMQGNVGTGATQWPPPSKNLNYCTGCKMGGKNGKTLTCNCPRSFASSCHGYDGCSNNEVGTLCPPGAPGSNKTYGYRCGTEDGTKKWLENSSSDWDTVLGSYGKSVSLDTSACPQFPLWTAMGLKPPAAGVEFFAKGGISTDTGLFCLPPNTGEHCPVCTPSDCNSDCPNWDAVTEGVQDAADLGTEAWATAAEIAMDALTVL